MASLVMWGSNTPGAPRGTRGRRHERREGRSSADGVVHPVWFRFVSVEVILSDC